MWNLGGVFGICLPSTKNCVCSAVFPVLINLRHDAAAPSSHFLGWFRVSRQSTMNDGWQVGPHSWLHAHMFIQRFCSFFDCQWRFSAFSVIVLQKFISIKLSVLYYPQYSPSFRWFCSGALLGFSRCFTRFFRFARSVQFDLTLVNHSSLYWTIWVCLSMSI